jgi:hypothetical protein
MRSFIVVDFGLAHTRTLLIDGVEGQYRLIASAYTRTSNAEENVILGLVRALKDIQARTGRRLVDENDATIIPSQDDGSGFDELVATASSAGRPLRAALVAMMDDVSLTSARRALTGTYIEETSALTLNTFEDEEKRINKLLRTQPDVIFIAGGTDGGNQEVMLDLIRLVEFAVRLLPSNLRPIVLYAGNADLGRWAVSRLERETLVFTADNVRPSLERENLQSAKLKLAQVFDRFLEKQPQGFKDISDNTAPINGIPMGIVPTAQSVQTVVRYLHELQPEKGVLYVDVGSGTSALLTSYQGQHGANIRSHLGLGHHSRALPKALDWRDVERWLPFPFTLDGFELWACNKALYPRTIPQTVRDLLIEQGVARELVRLLIKEARQTWAQTDTPHPPFSPLIGAGAVFSQHLPPTLSALLLLDALEPRGVCDLWLDPDGLAPALGALSRVEPLALVQVLENSGFVRLGTAFCPTGRLARAKMRVSLTLPNGETLEKRLSAGDLWMPSLPAGQKVSVSVRLSRNLRLEGKRRWTGEVEVGTAGLLFDLRGRPVLFPSGRKRRRVIGEWLSMGLGLKLDERMYESESEKADAMTATATLLSIEDFPDFSTLPKQGFEAHFARLLAELDENRAQAGVAMEAFPLPADSADDEMADLAKELGLR